MERLTRDDRQKILDEFVEKHGGWDARAFVEEVRATNGQHPAWTWFGGFDVDKAAFEHWTQRAMQFASGLRVKFSVETIEHGKVTVRYVEAPVVFSPLATRRTGGGYIALNRDDPAIMDAFCAEAASALQAWIDRYSAAVVYAKGSTAALNKLVGVLEARSPKDQAA